MAWITPNTIKERLGGPEYAGVTGAALGSGQVANTLVDNELGRIIKMVRGYVGKKNFLGMGDTIPDELETAVLAILVYQILTRIPGLSTLLTKERVDAKKDAMQLLRDVAAGDFVIVPPDNVAPVAEQPSNKSTIGTVRKGARQNTRERLEGLF